MQSLCSDMQTDGIGSQSSFCDFFFVHLHMKILVS